MAEKVMYLYDGSFYGFLCCVYNFYYNSLKPAGIVSYDDYQPSFYQNFQVETDSEQAKKVILAIAGKMSPACLDFLQDCFLTDLKEKEMYMLRFIVKGFKVGGGIKDMLTDSDVARLYKAQVNISRERHLYLGIIRFYKAGEIYVSVIEPNNSILPLIAPHFTERFGKSKFIIYDKTHSLALIYSEGRHRVIQAQGIELPPADSRERRLENMWKTFYNAVAIRERYNPRCRMNFIPKYRWKYMNELSGQERISTEKNRRTGLLQTGGKP